MTKESRWLALFVAVAVAPGLQADQWKMRTAAVVDGTYVGGDQSTSASESADGVTGTAAAIDTADRTFLPGKRRCCPPRLWRRIRLARRRR